MSIKRDDAILQGLAEYWKDEELIDFTVTVGNAHFRCHRLLLASCSDFFRGLFRSNMQETAQKCVNIQGIASETFELILERIYTGHVILTDDNVIDMWRAADQLQIHFLVSECENFVVNILSLENFVDYFHISNTLNSTAVLEAWWIFVAKNCYSFFETICFLEMPMADVLRLIKSQELETKSEDDVILAILKWAEFQANLFPCSKVKEDSSELLEKKDRNEEDENNYGHTQCRKKDKIAPDTRHLMVNLTHVSRVDARDKKDNQENVNSNEMAILLSNTRTYLVSQECLKMLVSHPLVRDNKEVINIVKDALHRRRNFSYEYWPTKAVHRNNSYFLHCIVTAVKREHFILFSAFSVARQKWYPISYLDGYHKTQEFFVVDNKIHALSSSLHNRADMNLLFWHHLDVMHLTTYPYDLCFAVVNSFVYFFSAQEQTVSRMYIKRHTISALSKLQGPEPIAHLMVYEENILVFHASLDEIVGQTMVRCYNTSKNSWTKQKIIEGRADGMISFRDEHFTYLLQSNGNLLKVIKPKSNILDFEIVAKLWSIKMSLHGAVTYLGDLYIGIQPNVGLPNDHQLPKSLQGLFRAIVYLEIASDEKAAFFPTLLSENDFHQDQLPPYITDKFTDLL